MGYTSVTVDETAVLAAAALASARPAPAVADPIGFITGSLRLLADTVMAEAGVVEPAIAARALLQSNGDIARAVSLVRAWAAMLSRFERVRVDMDELRATRRISPGFKEPRGGQYLGASLDYQQRLLDLRSGDASGDGHPMKGVAGNGGSASPAQGAAASGDGNAVPGREPDPMPQHFRRALEPLTLEGFVDPEPQATPRDITRIPLLPSHRGALQQLLCRADTGAMTAIGYTGIRGWGQRPDPTLAELRCGKLPVRIHRPQGGTFEVGEIDATMAEVVLYRASEDGATDLHFTLGIGATPGRVERRAIAAAILDGNSARARSEASGAKTPVEDAEFLSVVLDGQEASGFVEHLRLPHYVTFTSELDRVRAGRTQAQS